MPVYEIPFSSDRSDVLRIMGYKKGKPVPEDILALMDEVLNELVDVVKPRVFYKQFSFKPEDKGKRLLINNEKAFLDEYIYEHLVKSDRLIVTVSTLGVEIDSICAAYFKNEDYLKGMMADAFGISMLNTLNRMFWLKAAGEAEQEGWGITRRFCPGTNGWDLSEQRVIFDLLEDDLTGLKLNESFMINALKSDTAIYGIGKGIKVSGVFHNCADCSLKDCQYKNEYSEYHEVKIHKDGESISIEAEVGTNLLELLRENRISVANACSGHHKCGKCKVRIMGTGIPPISEQESGFLRTEEINRGLRLACFVEIQSDMEVYLDSAEENAKILVEGTVENTSFTYDTGTPGSNRAVCYGIAFDIGTTTIAAYLADKSTGQTVDTCSSLNPQRSFGADVISRINHTILRENGLEELQGIIVEELNGMIGRMCERSSILRENIMEAAAAGNTTMLHLLMGVPCSGIASAPFTPVFTDMMNIEAKAVKLHINNEGRLITLPCKSGYVGADTIAAVLASGMYKEEEICLLLDIGTNGEIVLGSRDRLLCCATAAGPAFEGANIRHGMGAVEGAIDHIKLHDGIKYTTIGGKSPRGICGSGIVDAVAELVRVGLIDESGRMLTKGQLSPDTPEWLENNLAEEEGKLIFYIDTESGICITQSDIRELQLAKSAIYAGIKVLINTMGIKVEDIGKVYLAGGFGNYVDMDSAVFIKMLPFLEQHKLKGIGNAAGTGARMVLLSDGMRSEAEKIKALMEYVELSGLKLFENEFIENMGF